MVDISLWNCEPRSQQTKPTHPPFSCSVSLALALFGSHSFVLKRRGEQGCGYALLLLLLLTEVLEEQETSCLRTRAK